MVREPQTLFWRGALGVLLAARVALAQAPAGTAPSANGADASVELFREGRLLLNKGRFDEACERFRAALELRRSPGTLLNVGNCLSSKGKLLDALKAFEETAALASSEPDEHKAAVWSSAAKAEIEALTPRIPHVVVRAPAEPGVEVTLDGEPQRAFGEPRALDPGSHRLVASAPGKLEFAQELALGEGQSLAIEVPRLEPVPVVAPPSASATGEAAAHTGEGAPAAGASNSRVLPWALVGVGGAVLAGGIVTGLVAANRASDLESDCPNHMCEGDLSQRDGVHDTAVLADVLMGVGLAATAAGVTWLVLTAEDDANAASISAACDLDGCGASVRGRF